MYIYTYVYIFTHGVKSTWQQLIRFPFAGYIYIYILIRYWMDLWFCPSAIETIFPLSNFKTKHIFGILMAERKFLIPFGAPESAEILGAAGAPIFFWRRPRHNFFISILSFTAAEGGGVSYGRRRHPSRGGRGKSGLWRVFREYIYIRKPSPLDHSCFGFLYQVETCQSVIL